MATYSHIHEGTSPSFLSWWKLPPALCISLRPTPFSIACPFSHCCCGDHVKPTQTSGQSNCAIWRRSRHGSDVLGTRGCRTTMIPSLNWNAAEVQRIVAPAWQGLSAMPDSAYSPLPPLVPDKAGRTALQNHRWFRFHSSGRLAFLLFAWHTCVLAFLDVFKKIFYQKISKEDTREQCT